jgi:hypothetical protein
MGKPFTWRRGTGIQIFNSGEVCDMQNAETRLKIIYERRPLRRQNVLDSGYWKAG